MAWFAKKIQPAPEPDPIKLPDAAWLKKVEEYTDCTPDLCKLEEKDWHFVFVYDETMRRNLKHDRIKGSEFLFTAFTQQQYVVYKKKLGLETFPFALKPTDDNSVSGWADPNAGPSGSRETPAQIKGELYKIRTGEIIALDKYKCNGLYFIRKRVKLVIPYRSVGVWLKDPKKMGMLFDEDIQTAKGCMMYKETVVEAWMYIGVREFWSKWIDGGYHFSPVKVYPKKHIGPYYYFNTQELDVDFKNSKKQTTVPEMLE